jgi:hypothetical protein
MTDISTTAPAAESGDAKALTDSGVICTDGENRRIGGHRVKRGGTWK